MAADLFETYVVTVGATMVLTALLVDVGLAELTTLMSLPLIVGGACIITSIIGTYFVRLGAGQSIMGALYKGFLTTAILRSEEHTSELQSLMRISYAVFCLKK